MSSRFCFFADEDRTTTGGVTVAAGGGFNVINHPGIAMLAERVDVVVDGGLLRPR